MARGRGPLFGRDEEMLLLRQVATAAGRGEPSGVLLLGEAGVGKTRLAAELASELEAEGAVVVTSHGVRLSGGELPYAGIAELVRGLVRAVGAAAMTQAAGRDLVALACFDASLGEEHPPERSAVTTALLAALEGLGRSRTVVWVVDDLPWLDTASRDLVGYLMAVVQHARLLMLATARDDTSDADDGPDDVLGLLRAPGITSLHIRPLGENAVHAQARSLSSRPLDATELDRIHRLSDGLPFFVEELVTSGRGTPPTLRKAVTMSTRDLSDHTRRLLRAAALEEMIARPDLVARVAGLTEAELATALAQARSRDIVRLDRDRDVLRFRHALLREAVDDELLTSERQSLHRRWAETLDEAAAQRGAPPNLVLTRARHWYLTGDPSAAHESVLAAARYVDGVEDNAAQALWWGRALETWPPSDPTDTARDKAVYQLLLAQVAIGEPQRALETLQRVVPADSTSGDRLRALWSLLVHRHLARVAGELEHAPPAPTDPDALLAWLRTVAPDFRVNAVLHFLLHEWDGSRPDLYVPICTELARRGEAEHDWDSWYLAKRHQGWWLQTQGDFDGQLEVARTARDLVLAKIPSRRLEAEWDWCWGLEEAGRYAEARTAAEAALAQVDDPRAVLQLWTVLAMCVVAACSMLGDWEAATIWLDRVDRQTGGQPDRPSAVLSAGIRGEMAARKGHLDVARELLGVVDTVRADPTMPWYVLPRTALRAEIALVSHDAEEAGHALLALEQLKHAVGTPDEVVQALLSLSRNDEVSDENLDRIEKVAQRLLPAGGQVQLMTRAEMGEHQRNRTRSDTADGWAAAASGWQALGRVYDAAWCRHLQASAAARDGDRQAAAAALAAAWAAASQLGAEPLCEQIARVARRTRLHLDGLATDTVAGLTERETEILRLISVGRTNAQIAAELFISPKTASVHVSRILAKLGAANRTEAAATARRLGVD